MDGTVQLVLQSLFLFVCCPNVLNQSSGSEVLSASPKTSVVLLAIALGLQTTFGIFDQGPAKTQPTLQ